MKEQNMRHDSPDSWGGDQDEKFLSDDDLLPEDIDDTSEDFEDVDTQLHPINDTTGDGFLPVPIPPSQPTPISKKPLVAERRSSVDDPNARFINFNKVFQSLKVDWNREKAYKVLASLRKRAILVGWSQEDLASVEASINLYLTVPRKCPGPKTSFRKKVGEKTNGDGDVEEIFETVETQECPCARLYGANPCIWKDQPCPSELVRIFQLFIQYVRSLEIEPTDYVDIQQICDIIRLHIYEERCDIELQELNSMNDMAVGAVAQKTGQVYYNKATAQAALTQKMFRDQRMALYKKLCADRTSRRETEFRNKKLLNEQKNIQNANDFVQIMAQVNKGNLLAREKNLIHDASKKESVIDVEYKDEQNG